jgi:hypothetical protein
MPNTNTKKNNNTNIDDVSIEKYKQMLSFVKNIVDNIESDLKKAKNILYKLELFDPRDSNTLIIDDSESVVMQHKLQSYTESDAHVIEWLFDWYFMIGSDQKKYPVPMNYASKTKLVPGDVLKLKILSDGKFVYKLIHPVERKHIRATLSKMDDNKFIAVTDDNQTYFLNQAAVTFFKGKPGDELYVMTNIDGSGSFAAIEAIIKK